MSDLKAPCLYPLDDGRRCAECDTCQPVPPRYHFGTSGPTWVDGIGPPLEQIAADYSEPIDGVHPGIAEDVLSLITEVKRLRAALVDIATTYSEDDLAWAIATQALETDSAAPGDVPGTSRAVAVDEGSTRTADHGLSSTNVPGPLRFRDTARKGQL